MPAYYHRNLDEAARLLQPLAGSQTAAKIVSKVALKERALNRLDSSTATAKEALALLHTAIEEYVQRNPLNFQFGLCRATQVQPTSKRVQLGNPSWITFDIRKVSDSGPCPVGQADDELTSLFKYHSWINLILADRSVGESGESLLIEARTSASLAIAMANSNEELAGAYDVFGHVFLESKDPSSAASAFASAYYYGGRKPWMKENWESAAKMAAHNDPVLHNEYDAGVEYAPRLSISDLPNHTSFSFGPH